MEPQKEQNIRTLFSTIANHAMSSTKVPIPAVKMVYDTWKAARLEDQAAELQLREQYVEKHEVPRNRREFEYNTYYAERAKAKQTWEDTQSTSDLRKLLDIKLPNELLAIPMSTVYTQYT